MTELHVQHSALVLTFLPVVQHHLTLGHESDVHGAWLVAHIGPATPESLTGQEPHTCEPLIARETGPNIVELMERCLSYCKNNSEFALRGPGGAPLYPREHSGPTTLLLTFRRVPVLKCNLAFIKSSAS